MPRNRIEKGFGGKSGLVFLAIFLWILFISCMGIKAINYSPGSKLVWDSIGVAFVLSSIIQALIITWWSEDALINYQRRRNQ